MLKEVALHRHLFWIASYTPGWAQSKVDQAQESAGRALGWLNELLRTLSLPSVQLTGDFSAEHTITANSLPSLELDQEFVNISSVQGRQIYFRLRQKEDIIWLYVQLVQLTSPDAETIPQLKSLLPKMRPDDDDLIGDFTIYAGVTDNADKQHGIAAVWLGTSPAHLRQADIVLEPNNTPASLYRGARPEVAIACLSPSDEGTGMQTLLLETLPDLARYLSKRNHLFEWEYQGKIGATLDKLVGEGPTPYSSGGRTPHRKRR